MPSSQFYSTIDTPKLIEDIPTNEKNKKPLIVNETTTKKFFNFCIPLNRQNCDDPYEASSLSFIVKHKNLVSNLFLRVIFF